MVIPDIGKLNFIISIHHSLDDDMTGGTIVLHKLAYELAQRDCNVYIFTKPAYEHPNIFVIPSSFSYNNGKTFYNWENFTYPYNNTVAIYPQTTLGNPFNCKNVVRWILYHTVEEIEKTYGADDVYFNFGNFETFKKNEHKKLTIFDYQFNKLYQTNFERRVGFCHIFHKHTPVNGESTIKIFKSKNLIDFETSKRLDFDFLREQLNKFEYFLTYDKKSFYTLAAILCGCKAIILDEDNKTEFFDNAYTKSDDFQVSISPTEYRIKNPIQMFGVAYGISDLSWADQTIKLAKPHLIELDRIDKKTVESFFQFWKNKIYDK